MRLAEKGYSVLVIEKGQTLEGKGFSDIKLEYAQVPVASVVAVFRLSKLTF